MRKRHLFVSISIIFFAACDSSDNSGTNYPISWKKDVKLTWENYKGIVDESAFHDCKTVVTLHATQRTEQDTQVFDISPFFSEELSFVKGDKKSDYLLNHEQRHFDLVEVYARMFRNQLANFSMDCNIDSFFVANRDSFKLICGEMQKRYDIETNHDLIEPMQEKWNFYIDSLLTAYESYHEQTIKVKRPKEKTQIYLVFPEKK